MIHEFDAPFIFWTKVNNHKEIKDTIVPVIKIISDNDNATVTVDGQLQHTIIKSIVTLQMIC